MQVAQKRLAQAHEHRKPRSAVTTHDRWFHEVQVDRWINEGGALARLETEMPNAEPATVSSAQHARGTIR
jgi:hypothetical protein